MPPRKKFDRLDPQRADRKISRILDDAHTVRGMIADHRAEGRYKLADTLEERLVKTVRYITAISTKVDVPDDLSGVE